METIITLDLGNLPIESILQKLKRYDIISYLIVPYYMEIHINCIGFKDNEKIKIKCNMNYTSPRASNEEFRMINNGLFQIVSYNISILLRFPLSEISNPDMFDITVFSNLINDRDHNTKGSIREAHNNAILCRYNNTIPTESSIKKSKSYNKDTWIPESNYNKILDAYNESKLADIY